MLYQFHLVDVLLFLAVVAGEDSVGHVEMGAHGLVVGDALGIVATYNTDYKQNRPLCVSLCVPFASYFLLRLRMMIIAIAATTMAAMV